MHCECGAKPHEHTTLLTKNRSESSSPKTNSSLKRAESTHAAAVSFPPSFSSCFPPGQHHRQLCCQEKRGGGGSRPPAPPLSPVHPLSCCSISRQRHSRAAHTSHTALSPHTEFSTMVGVRCPLAFSTFPSQRTRPLPTNHPPPTTFVECVFLLLKYRSLDSRRPRTPSRRTAALSPLVCALLGSTFVPLRFLPPSRRLLRHHK